MQSAWKPSLTAFEGAIWQRLVEALAADVADGRLAGGSRMPPQRELAHRLGLSVGTVSRAYAEAERRGLLASHVGRGTFVTQPSPRTLDHRLAGGRINLSTNVPPVGPALGAIEQTLADLGRRGDLAAMFDYTSAAGLAAVREAGAAWLKRRGGVSRAQADRLIQTNGGQHALLLACSTLAGRGDTVLCDAATYPGNRTIAEHGGWHLRGVAADAWGMDPAALDKAAAETRARAVILIPTLHNPTAITMDAARRSEIVEVARARGLIIIEDDIYRVFGQGEEPAPFAELAPERVIYVSSLSKALSPGLRLGFILPPDNDELFRRLLLAAQATVYCPPAAGGLIFSSWMESGLASTILEGVQAEAQWRNQLARHVLGNAVAAPSSERSLHLWLPMTPDRAHSVYTHALKAGVDLTPPEAPFVDPAGVDGLRVCLGTPLERAELERGLEAVKAALNDGGSPSSGGIV